jgi:cleavage stimulation factor subunit 3
VHDSFLLTFAYAEVQELNGNFAEVHSTYENFLDILRHELEALESRASLANSSFSSNISPTTNQPSFTSQQEQTQDSNNSQNTSASFSTQNSDDKPQKSKELAERKSELALAMIMFVRFCRRAEGLKASRALFTKMRKDRWTSWEVYEAAALTEYHCTKKMDVAGRIFEKGLELFGDEVEFVLRYLGFLISVNDENS